MNIVSGSMAGSEFLFADGTSIDLGPLPTDVKDGPITLGVRPEHLRLDPAGTMAEIVVIEPTGSETQVTLSLSGQDLVGVFRERINAGPGERIGISFDKHLLHLFNASTGMRIPR
jgi:multiple sugar transport system ATP-binding protein